MLTLRSGKIFKGLRTAMSALLLLLSFICRYAQGAVYATFSVRGKQSEAAQSACAHRCYCTGQNRGHAEEMLLW